MKTAKFTLCALGMSLILSAISYAYDIVQVTNTPEADETEYSVAIFGNTVYAAWISSLPNNSGGEIYFDKSTDFGKTWGTYRKVIARSRQERVFQSPPPKIYISQSGKIFVLYGFTYYGGDRPISMVISEDGGNNFFGGGPTFSLVSNYDFVVNGNIIYVTCISPYGTYWTKVYLWKSSDGGNSFSESKELFQVWQGGGITIETNSNGERVYIFLNHTDVGGYRPHIYFTKSLDYGENFTELKRVYPGTSSDWYETGIDSALDESGKIYLNWQFTPHDWTSRDHAIYLSESSDSGENFSLTRISDYYSWYYYPREGRPYSSSMSVDGAGNVYSTFYKVIIQNDVLSWGLYFDKRIAAGEFNIDQYLGVTSKYFSNKPMLVVAPDGKIAFIMWNNSETSDGNHDLFCITFPINKPPVLNPIGNKEVNEGDLLEFTASATDLDDDVLTYSAKYLPYGATFDSQTGVFSWRPEYFMGNPSGPINYEIKFTVSDGLHIGEEIITITVHNTNRSPVITPIGNKTGNEGELLQFSVSATDPDGDKVTYSILNAPEGAKIDANTGLFEWTPTYKQAGSYVVTFVASDGSASAGETITITVNNVRRPDLTIGTITYSPPKPRPGAQVQFKALIRNIGDMKTGKFRVSLNVAGETKTKTISGLAAGRSTYTIFYWKAKKGTHTVTVTADPANMIQEQDEDNNVGQREVVVK